MKASSDKQLFNYNLLPHKYKVLKFINQGSYGKIYKGIDMANGAPVALKIAFNPKSGKYLKSESEILKILKGHGIPEIKYFGEYPNYNVLIEPFLGKSLGFLFNENNKKFLLNDVLLIAIQIINRLKFIHSKGIIHCDIKPDNFIPEKNILYIIDFGLSSFFIINKKHIECKESNKIIGTAKYASVNALQGIELSRRDDLESLAYMLIYLMKGNLPWEHIKEKNKIEKYKKILKIKKNCVPLELCENIPNEFSLFLLYARSLEFEEKPDYDYCRELFSKLIKKNKSVNEIIFSWNENVRKNTIENNKNDMDAYCCGVVNLKIKNYNYKNSKKSNNKHSVCNRNKDHLGKRYIKYINYSIKNETPKYQNPKKILLSNDDNDHLTKKNNYSEKKPNQKIKLNLDKIKLIIFMNKFQKLKKYFEKNVPREKLLSGNRRINSEEKNIFKSKIKFRSKSKKKKDDFDANTTNKKIHPITIYNNYNIKSLSPIFKKGFSLQESNFFINYMNYPHNNTLLKNPFNYNNNYYNNFYTNRVRLYNDEGFRKKHADKNKKSYSINYSPNFIKTNKLLLKLNQISKNNNISYKAMKNETKTNNSNYSFQSCTNNISNTIQNSNKKHPFQRKIHKEKLKIKQKVYNRIITLEKNNKSRPLTLLHKDLNYNNNTRLQKKIKNRSNLAHILYSDIYDKRKINIISLNSICSSSENSDN